MKSRYIQRYDDEVIELPLHKKKITKSGRVSKRTYRMSIACCDCGLIHEYEWTYSNGKLFNKAKRNARATSAYRRYHPPKV
jgi:hypothetical protein